MSKTYENSSFTVTSTVEPGCRISLNIEVKPEQVKKAYKKAVKTVNKQISIPGFRKGKAPDGTVISRYGSYIESEWKEVLVQEAYRAALDLTQIFPLNKESISSPKIEKYSQEEGALISLSYEHYPEVPEIDFAAITLPEIESTPVGEERIDEALEEIRRSQADFEPVEGRAVEQGDYVDVTINAIDRDPPEPIVTDRRFEVDPKRIAPWLCTLLIGMKVDEEAEGLSELDEKADEEARKNFKPTQVRITLHSIKKIVLPEIGEDLAKKSGADSLEVLKVRIRENLTKEADEERRKKQIEVLETVLLETYSFEIPQSAALKEREARIRAKIEEMKAKELTDEAIKSQEHEIESQVSEEVDKAYRLYFLEQKMAKQGDIVVTEKEINALIQENPYFLQMEGSQELVSRMANALFQRKVKEYALQQVLGKNA